MVPRNVALVYSPYPRHDLTQHVKAMGVIGLVPSAVLNQHFDVLV